MLQLSEPKNSGKRIFSRAIPVSAGEGRILENRRVLVVEDEFFVGLDLAQTLEEMGAKVSGPAADLASAEKLLREQSFDLVLLDVNLEGGNTLELAVRLKADKIPVAFVTAYVASATLFGAEHEGIPRLGKPTSRQDLMRIIRALLIS